MRTNHNHCQSKLRQNCRWWKFCTPKTRFGVIGERGNSLQLAYQLSSKGTLINSTRAHTFAVWSTFVNPHGWHVGNAQEIHIEWTHKFKPKTWEPSWVFSSRSSISNPSFSSFLKGIFGHALLFSSTTHPSCQETLQQSLVSFSTYHPLPLYPPPISQMDDIKAQSHKVILLLKFKVFQLFHLLSCSRSPMLTDPSYNISFQFSTHATSRLLEPQSHYSSIPPKYLQ